MKLKKGELINTVNGVGIILKHVQTAWGAEKYKVLVAGEIRYMWDKQFVKIDEEECR